MYFKVKPVPGTLYGLANKPLEKPNHLNKLKTRCSKCMSNCDYLLGVLKYFKSFLENSVTHCYVYLIRDGLTIVERVFWLILIIISHYYCFFIAMQSISRFMDTNSYMGIERNYFDWNTTLPSITICPMERINLEKFNNFCEVHGIDDARREEFFIFMERLANATYVNFQDIPRLQTTESILEELQLKPDRYMELIYNLTSDETYNPNEKQRIRCVDNNIYIHTRQILTEYGLCYVTNNFLPETYTSKYLIFGEMQEPNPYVDAAYVRQVHYGSYPDKYVDFNFIGFQSPMDFYSHSPFEVMKVDNNYGYSTDNMYFEPAVQEITTTDNFEVDANIRQRNCRFVHESNLTHFPVYTKNLCMQECRINLVYKICKCIPHFYPNRIKNPKPVCDYKTLIDCFPNNTAYFMKLYRTTSLLQIEDIAPCYCHQNCMDSVISVKVSHLTKTKEFFGGKGAVLSMKQWPTTRLKRQILFTLTDLLVYIGGTAGLFMGFSVLGLIEMIYFFTMHLIFHLMGYKL